MTFKSHSLKAVALSGLLGAMLSSCFDNNYDLSDIDSTVRVPVNDLVVPINIDAVHLSNIIDIKEGDRLQIVDGRYCVIESGDFNSSDITINAVHLAAPEIKPTETQIRIPDVNARSPRREPGLELSYQLYSEPTAFEFKGDGNADILAIDSIYTAFSIKVEMTFDGLDRLVNGATIDNLQFQLPAGLNLTMDREGTYDAATGLLTLPNLRLSSSRESIELSVSEIDFARMGGTYADQHVAIEGELQVSDGTLLISDSDLKAGITLADVPPVMEMRIDYTMSPIDINRFSGTIQYDISGVNINDIDLTDMPDVLTQEGTEIMLKNPQLYLTVNNPLHRYDLEARTGLELTAYSRFEGGEPRVCHTDEPVIITGTGAEGINRFCLSPEAPANPIEGYADATHVSFRSLGIVFVAYKGFPSRIAVNLTDPKVPSQRVSNFELGTNLSAIHGSYTFMAPLDFSPGASICYADTLDGWSSDFLENLTIEALDVNLKVTSDIPLRAQLTGYPIDKQGRQINGVNIEGATIEALAQGQKVTIRISGAVTDLDGIIFNAFVTAEGSQTLTPEMSLKLEDIRPCVRGYYEKEL